MINKLSQKVGLDLAYFIKSGFWIYLGKGIEVSKGLIMSILYAALLSKTAYGQFTFIIAFYELAKVVALPGIDLSIIQASCRGYDGVYTQGMKLKVRWSLLSSLILMITALTYFLLGDQVLSIVFLILACLIPLESISDLFRSLLSAKKQFRTMTLVGSIFEIITAGALIFIVFQYRSPMLLVLTIMALRVIILTSYSVWGTKKYLENEKVDNSSIKFGKQASIIKVLNLAEIYLDKIIVGLVLGFPSLAIYTIIIIFADNIKQALIPITNSFIPKLVDLKVTQTNKKVMWRHLIKMYIPLTIIISIYFLLVPFAYKYLYPAYQDAAESFAILYGVVLLAVPAVLFESYFIAHKKIRSIIVMNAVPTILLIILLPIFASTWGIFGAVLSLMIIHMSRLLSAGFAYERSIKSE